MEDRLTPFESFSKVCETLPDQDQRQDDRQERSRIDVIDCRLPGKGNRKSAQGRAKDGTGLEGNGGHAEGVGQVFGRDQVGHQRLAGRAIEGNRHRLHGGQRVNVPERDMPEIGQQAQGQGSERRHRLRDEDDGAAVVRVCDSAANQRKDDHRQDARRADPAQRNRLVGQFADVPEQCPDLHLGAGYRNHQAKPQIEETTMF